MKDARLMAVGDRIRAIRASKAVSQEDFATAAGLDRAYYGGVERGERNLAALNLMKIAVGLDVEVGELFPKLAALRRIGKDPK